MNNQSNNADPKTELDLLTDNHHDEYWTKKYGVSAEDLKKTGDKRDLTSKILEATFKKKAYSF
jgi:hypothetical protein